MNAFSLINLALGGFVISAVLAWVVCAHRARSAVPSPGLAGQSPAP